MQKGRLVYIEPNDIVKDHIKLFDSSHKNFTWNPEDLNLYVDLQVVCPSRDDCGEEPTISNGTYSNTYISLMEGTKIGRNGYLTTDFTNISYSEIEKNNVSSKEALGITSIDITFDAHFYPKVTINFTDVRAYSLFMPAEEEYKEDMETQAYESLDEEGNRRYHERGRAYTNFFNAVFHFPYPRFLLTVKGFYGTKVTFILAVETFRSALNSSTGNFDVSINFIGYMYGIYTDIPMNLLMVAPYAGTLDYNNDDVLLKGDYWNKQIQNKIFFTKDKYGNEEEIPTFLEFAKKYSMALSNLNENVGIIGNDIVITNNITNLLSNIDEIIKQFNYLVFNVFAYNENVPNETLYKYYVGKNSNKKYVFFIFEKNNTDTNIEVYWKTEKAKALYDLITNTNNTYGELLNNNSITLPLLCQNLPSDETKTKIYAYILGKLDQVINVKEVDGKKTVSIKDNIDTVSTLSINEEKYEYKINEEDTNSLVKFVESQINKDDGTKIENYYFCAINVYELINNLNKLKKTLEKEKTEKQEAANLQAEDYISKALGFTPNIENIFRMVFAHLQCFFHEYLDECIYKIKNSRRSINDDIFGSELNSENTDIKYKDANGNTFLPPFFAYYQFKDEEQQKELAYPDMYDIEEVRLVTRLLNSTKQFSEEYNKIANEIIELSETDTHYNDEETINTSGLPINFDGGFIPSSYYDIFYGDKNPYSYIDTNTPTLIKDIFYVFILRYYALTMLNAKTDKDEFLNNEVGNIVECFTDLKQYMLTETFDRGQDGAKLYEYMNDYSKKRIVPIDNLDIPKKEIIKFKKLLLLTRIDISSTYSDAEREIALQNTHENTFDFLNGIKVLNDCEYAKFETLKGVLENNKLETQKSYILYDNTEYIKDNKGASKNAHHKILKTKPITDVNVTGTILTSEGVNQLPIGEECNQYTLPFTLAASKGNSGTLTYQNLLYHLSKGNKLKFSNDKELDLSKLDNVGKGFFILSSLIVSIQDIRDSFNSEDTDANDILGNKICKTRKIIPLFYGCLLYLFRKKFIEDIDIVPNLITIDARDGERIDQAGSFHVNLCITENSELNGNTGFFRYDYQTVQVSDNKNSKVIVTLIKQLLCSYSEKHVDKKFKPDDINNKVIHEIFLEKNGLTALEEYFLKETKDNGIIQEIITSAKEENTFNGNIQIDGFSLNGIEIYPITGKTSNALVRLMSETVCTIATNYRTEKLQDKDTFQDIEFKNSLEKRLEIFYKKLYNVCKKEEKTKEVEEYNTSDTQLNVDVKISLYYTLKSLYDKWICSYGNMERFQLNKLEYDEQTKDNRFKKGTQVNNKSEINNFLFVDSLYRDIGKNFICDPSSLIKITMNCFEGQNNFSVYQFLHLLCQENKLLMRAVPVYNNFYEEDGLKEVFTPKDVFNINQSQENAFSSTYLIMYTHQPSVHLNNPNSGYNDDSIYIGNDIGRTIVTKDFEKIFMDKNKGYLVPTFGVTYGMQNQSYFKGININMDNPITTDYSIANQLMLSQTAASSGDLNLPIGIGQNIYSIYSNRSYNCTVEMMGCANIMPMMYFQLNNIPMFKGVYMIVSVKHSIRSGNMTTTFTGVRQTSIIYPFVNSGLILTSILDKFNGPISYKSSTEIESPDRKGSSTEIETPKTSQIGIEANIIESQYYNLAIHNGSLVDTKWMEDRRNEWRKKKAEEIENNKKKKTKKKPYPYDDIGNTYWGYANNGKLYPLNHIQNRKIDYIILHMANTPDSTFDKGTNNFRALNMRNGWFAKWVQSRGKTKVSADFGVDDTHIVQFTPDYKDYAGLSVDGNISGISIEMCNTFSGTYAEYAKDIANRPQYGFSEQVLENTRKLIIEIFLQIGPKDITTHYRRRVAVKAKDPKKCPGIWGWNTAVKRNENGVDMRDKGLLVFNDEKSLEAFVESVWAEWKTVAQEKGREVGTKIKIV